MFAHVTRNTHLFYFGHRNIVVSKENENVSVFPYVLGIHELCTMIHWMIALLEGHIRPCGHQGLYVWGVIHKLRSTRRGQVTRLSASLGSLVVGIKKKIYEFRLLRLFLSCVTRCNCTVVSNLQCLLPVGSAVVKYWSVNLWELGLDLSGLNWCLFHSAFSLLHRLNV